MHLDDWISTPVPEHIILEASAWIIKQSQYTLDPESNQAFNQWLAEDPINTWTYEELSLLWAKLNTLPEHEVEFLQSKVFVFPAQDKPNQTTQIPAKIYTDNLLAYCMIGIIGLGFLVKMF